MNPTEEHIRKIMNDTGMDYLQARRYLQSLIRLRQRANLYPLGKSSHFA